MQRLFTKLNLLGELWRQSMEVVFADKEQVPEASSAQVIGVHDLLAIGPVCINFPAIIDSVGKVSRVLQVRVLG